MHTFEPGDYVSVDLGNHTAFGKITKVNKKTVGIVLPGEERSQNLSPELLTYLPPFDFGPENLRKLARLEDTYSHLTRNMHVPENVRINGTYRITCDDLLEALKNARALALSPAMLSEEWIIPIISWVQDGFPFTPDTDGDPDPELLIGLLPESHAPFFYWMIILKQVHSGELDYDKLIRYLEIHVNNRSVPLQQRRLPLPEMEEFVKSNQHIGADEPDFETIRPLFIRYTEKLCEEDSIIGLEARAYGSFGGDVFFPCDWKQAETDLLRLFSLTEDPSYADHLGDLYYFGRTNDSIPQYDQALRWYIIGEAAGKPHSACKVSDMFWEGNGVPKTRKNSVTVLRPLFPHTLYGLLHGQTDTALADVSLRLGKRIRDIPFLENGRGAELFTPEFFLLLAEYSIGIRLGNGGLRRDAELAEDIRTAIDAEGIKHLVPVPSGRIRFSPARFFAVNNIGEIKMRFRGKNDSVMILPDAGDGSEPVRMLVVMPEEGICSLTDRIVITGPELIVTDTDDSDHSITDVRMEDGVLYFELDGNEKVAVFANEYFCKFKPVEWGKED